MSNRGFQIAVFTLCFVMAAGTLGAMGLYADWGVSVDPGADNPAGDLDEEDAVVDPTAESDEGFIGPSLPGVGLLQTLSEWVRGVASILTNIGLPEPLATPIGTVALIAVSIAIAKFIRGV